MEISRADAADAERFHQFYEVWSAAETDGRPGVAPSLTEAEGRILVESQVPSERVEAYVASIDDAVVASGLAWYSDVDNLDIINVHVAVAPANRGNGFGSGLLDVLMDRAVELGRRVVLASSWIPFDRRDDHPFLSFAGRHGFAVANVEVRRVLDLPVDQRRLGDWRTQAEAMHAGYRIETVRGDVPDRWVPSLVEAMNLLGKDMPTGDIVFEPRGMTPEIFAAREDRQRRAGNQMLRAIALNADDVVAGFTTMMVPDGPGAVHQYGTLVRRSHRGHRLGLALKTAALVELQASHPERKQVETENSEQNASMVAINDLMGFRPVEFHTGFQRKL
jgi:GNAT superfamily N-acetyltransferase